MGPTTKSLTTAMSPPQRLARWAGDLLAKTYLCDLLLHPYNRCAVANLWTYAFLVDKPPAPRRPAPHPTPQEMAEFCYSHCEPEPDPGWRRCLECQHLYHSPQELEQATADLGFHLPAAKIFDCAHCGHDL